MWQAQQMDTDTEAPAFVQAINDAAADRLELVDAAAALRSAIEADRKARESLRIYRTLYEADEAAVLAEAHANATGKNAEARRAEVDFVVATERKPQGELFVNWVAVSRFTTEAADAAAALEAAKVRFSAARAAAALSVAMLTTLADADPA